MSPDTTIMHTVFLPLALLTAAIYFTGGPYSPLLSTYVIVIAVLSLLTNLGVTIMMASFIVLCFSTMLVLMATGVLPPTPVPGSPGAVPSIGYTVTAVAFASWMHTVSSSPLPPSRSVQRPASDARPSVSTFTPALLTL